MVQTLFERMGGLSATRKLADEFYDVMEVDETAQRLLEMHPKKLVMSRFKLYKFLTEWFGGPKLFGEQYVNAEWLELKHRRLNFTDDEKDLWLYCMSNAMSNLDYQKQIKEEIMTKFIQMIESIQSINKNI